LGLCNPILVLSDEFSGYVFPTVKSKNHFGNNYSLRSNYYFPETGV
jgi:hypothetical protein